MLVSCQLDQRYRRVEALDSCTDSSTKGVGGEHMRRSGASRRPASEVAERPQSDDGSSCAEEPHDQEPTGELGVRVKSIRSIPKQCRLAV